MNLKIKTLLFALLVVFAVSVKAEETPSSKKYEYATVTQNFSLLYVSYAGKSYETIKLPNTKFQTDHHELIEYVENLQNEGWSVYLTSETDTRYTFVLRRPKK